MSDPVFNSQETPGPFTIGKAYRVRKNFKALRDSFIEGEVLLYESMAWSRYDGITGYFFTQAGQAGNRTWDIADDGDLNTWRDFFEEMEERPD